MDVELLKIEPGTDRKIHGTEVGAAIDNLHNTSETRVFAVVATGGTTNLGIIDDLETVGAATHARDIWFHVDGAYGLAALCAPSVRAKFNGVEKADSLIVDPHKWLFAHDDSWSPSDYAIHLTRRVRGLPFWFSLAAHGTDAYTEAMEETLNVAHAAADLVRGHPNLELVMEPELSIVAFKRKGWAPADYQKWSDKLLADQIGFIPPSSDKGDAILRFAIVNPWTKISDISMILDTL
jgi:glutamate/tyrosine decarboxylase-like PLP-dependent enzyme